MNSWYALNIRPRSENQALNYFQGKGINCFFPLFNGTHQLDNSDKGIDRPLFPGIIFVNTKSIIANELSGNIFISGNPGNIIPDHKIVNLKKITSQSTYNFKVDFNNYPSGNSCSVISGILKGLVGKYIKIKNKLWLLLRIEKIGANLLLDIPDNEIKIIE